ncbi:MAG: hypothetical protein ACYTX0_02180 [Nostoc sp.]
MCVIEDVITTGGQVVKSTEALRNAGAIADLVICVIWRGSKQDNGNISMSVKSLVKPHPNPLRGFGEGARILFLVWYICFH